MRTQNITVDHKIPGIVYGEPSEWVYLYVHGKRGCKEEALPFAEQADAMGYQVMAIDLPEPEAVWAALNPENKISLYANVGGTVRIFNKNLGD